MEENYTFRDIQREMAGLIVGHLTFLEALKGRLGDKEAVRWFYHTSVPEFEHKTPAQYILERGDEGRAFVASSLYLLLTGQPN